MMSGGTISIIAFIRSIMTRIISNDKRNKHKDEKSSKENFRTISDNQHVGDIST